jgi:hypothetical protein
MKIKFTQLRELADGRIVNLGDTLESPKDGSDELMQAYVDNGIAVPAAFDPKPKEVIADAS